MKKIFYFIASAIVALGAMACQNEVDENITPENTNEISFTVSFDESTRVEGTVEGKTASFEIDGSEILTIGDVELSYDEEKEVFVATSDEDKATLNGLIGETVTATIEDVQNSLKFASAEFELAQKNEITVSLACPALYFTVPADTEIALTVNDEMIATYVEGDYFLGIEGTTAKISYSINKEKVKETTLNGMTNKVYNLGTLRAKSEWAIIGSFAASNWSDIAMYEDGNYAVAYNVALASANNVKFRKYSWDNDKQRTCITAFTKNNITYLKNDGSDSPECGLTGNYDIYIPKVNAGYAIVVEAGQPLPNTLGSTTISLIGTAVGGWDTANDVVLTWNKETGLFSKENETVVAGEIKLRANKGWVHSWGSGGALTATHEIWYNGGNSTIAAGTYNISTDLKSVTVASVK